MITRKKSVEISTEIIKIELRQIFLISRHLQLSLEHRIRHSQNRHGTTLYTSFRHILTIYDTMTVYDLMYGL
jgi:hypothetical protein